MKSRQEIERLSRQKMKNRLLLILLCVMVLAITAAIILVNVIPEEQPTEKPKSDPPEILEGIEDIYNNYQLYNILEKAFLYKKKKKNKIRA